MLQRRSGQTHLSLLYCLSYLLMLLLLLVFVIPANSFVPLRCTPSSTATPSRHINIMFPYRVNIGMSLKDGIINNCQGIGAADEATVRLATAKDNGAPLLDLINRAYDIGETGIIVTPFSRLLPSELTDMIAQQQLLVLVCTDADPHVEPKILGCVKVQAVATSADNDANENINSGGDRHDADTPIIGEWGCLAVDPSLQNRGYGLQLVQAAETYLVREKHCSSLHLELLAPSSTWPSPSVHKERLREWYTQRLGYELKVVDDYEKSTVSFPQGTKLLNRFVLACDADFTTYSKRSSQATVSRCAGWADAT